MPIRAVLRRPIALGVTLVGVAVLGLWWSALRAERALRREADASLARQAAAYLSVVTPPDPNTGYNSARLLSSANALAASSFWHGGLQIVIGSTPLVPDTIGLLPLDSIAMAAMVRGESTIKVGPEARPVALVPFLDRDRSATLGWVAAWGTLGEEWNRLDAVALTLLVLVALPFAILAFLREHDRRYRLIAYGVAAGLLVALALDLGWGVRRTAVLATDLRLLTARRLIEVAATSMGVRQANLPAIAVGLRVHRLDGVVDTAQDVIREDQEDGTVATIVAATPRTRDALELGLRPVESGMDPLWGALLSWALVGAVGLGYAAWTIQHSES